MLERKREARNALVAGDLELARVLFGALVEVDPDWALNGLGAVEERCGNFAEAERRYRAAIDARSEVASYRVRLYHVLTRLGRADEASAVAHDLATGWPNDPAAVHIGALDDVRHGRIAEATEVLDRALATFPDDPALVTLSVALDERAERWASAAHRQSRLVEAAPTDMPKRLHLLRLLAKAHDEAGIEPHVEWFRANAPRDPGFLEWKSDRLRARARILADGGAPFEIYAGLLPHLSDETARSVEPAAFPAGSVSRQQAWERVIDRICDETAIRFADGRFHFIEKTDLPVLLNEIFVSEDYWFACETDHPFIIDCGANIGLGILYQKLRRPNCEVLAFEPGRRAFATLTRNAKSMNWSKVTLLPYAVDGQEGVAEFFDPEDMPMAGSLTTRMTDRHFDVTSYRVETKRLSTFIDRRVDFLKLDVEGAETAVLNDIAGSLHLVKQIFCEIHYDYAGPKDDGAVIEILSLLKAHDFETLLMPASLERAAQHRPAARVSTRTSFNLWARNRSRD